MTVLIKKYKNRRLYDTEKSQYITIEDLKDYVLKNKSFKVQEATTDKDLTNATLLQILLEMDNGSTRFLSEEILRNLVRVAHNPLQQSMTGMLEQMFSRMETLENPWTKGMEEWNKYLEILNPHFRKK